MALTEYTYSIQNDFPNGKVAPDRLAQEIRQSPIVIALDTIDTLGDDCNIWFKDPLSVGDKAILDGIVATHNGEPLQGPGSPVTLWSGDAPVPTSNGAPLSATIKPSSPKVTIITHDWTDRTTWYQQAVRVVAEVAVYNAGGYWQLANTNAIDTYHGKLTQEDFLKDAGGNSYRVSVTRNGAPVVEQDPAYGAGGDYIVDYALGQISPVVPGAWDPADAIAATYHHATTSLFTIKPLPGKRLILDFVEVQMGADVVLTDGVSFQPYGFVEVFAPQLMAPPYNIPAGTQIPLGDPLIYKGMKDYQNDAVKSYVAYPALGGPGWRGLQQPIYVFDWDYVRATTLSSQAGMEIRIVLQHELAFGGNFATVSFYCSSDNE